MTAPNRPLHILMVDDNAADRMLAEVAFETQSIPHTFRTVNSGQAALDILNGPRPERPDLVLLDLNMPGLNGFEVLDRVKGDAATKHLPVVVLTTSDRAADRLRAYQHQASAYLVKPIKAGELERLAARLLTFWSAAQFADLSE